MISPILIMKGHPMLRHLTLAIIGAGALLSTFRATAAPGDLDLTFGTGGKVTTAIGSNQDEGYSVVVQSDGKILVAGQSFNDSYDFALVRYTTTGTLDTSFNGTGKVTTTISGGRSEDRCYSAAVQSDGKIVVAGLSDNFNNSDFALLRYTSVGTLDTSFNGTGKVTTDFGGGDYGYSVAVQSDGKIVVAGSSSSDFALVRYTSTGTLDTSFNGTGKVTTDFGSGEEGRSVAVQSDGKIVVAGYSFNGSSFDFALARYNSTGTLDTSFNGTGKVTTDFGSGDFGNSVAVQSDGKIVVAGSSSSDFALVRYTSTGTLDTSFNGTGKVTTDFSSGDECNSVTVQSDGKIMVAGGSSNGIYGNFALVCYNSNGTLDTSFNDTGKVTTDFGSNAEGHSMAVQSDGKIVIAGYSYNGSSNGFALARYDSGVSAFPELSIEQPLGTNLNDGATKNLTTAVVGSTSDVTFTLKNTGTADLTLSGTPKVAVSGPHAAMFSIVTQPLSPVSSPSGSTPFVVRFAPTSSGTKTASLSIPNNDSDENPFDIVLTASSLSFSTDSDADGLNDASEFQLAALGFDWQVNQASLVTTLFSNLNGAGYYTTAQIQALNVGVPLLQKNPTTGAFTLTLGVEKSTNLSTFTPFPMTAPQTVINGVGKLEFQFTVPDNAAFFKVQAQ